MKIKIMLSDTVGESKTEIRESVHIHIPADVPMFKIQRELCSKFVNALQRFNKTKDRNECLLRWEKLLDGSAYIERLLSDMSPQPNGEKNAAPEPKGDWVYERSSGYDGFRCQKCAVWIHQGTPFSCNCDYPI